MAAGSGPGAAVIRGGRIGKAVVALAILLLGAVAASRLPLSNRPEIALPEMTFFLDLPEASDPEEVTRRWLVPAESAIRALGGVTGTSGEVSSTGAWLTVHLEAGADPRVKAARLLSELASLRSALPDGARVDVWPSSTGAGERAALLVLAGRSAAAEAERIAGEIRRLRGVRDVVVYGGEARERWVEMRAGPAAAPDTVTRARRAVLGSGTASRLGEIRRAGRSLPVLSGDAAGGDLPRLPVRSGGKVVLLGSIAEITTRVPEPARRFRSDARPAVALGVVRQPGSSLMALDTDLRRFAAELTRTSAGSLDLSILDSEGEPLRRMLVHLAAGAAAASAVALMAGWWLGGWLFGLALAGLVPVAGAAALNAYWLAGVGVDAATLQALVLAVAVALPLAFVRYGAGRAASRGAAALWALAALLLLVAVSIGKSFLQPGLGEAARAFTIAALAAVASVLMVPVRARPVRAPRWARGRRRRWMRDPLSVLLVAGTGLAVSFSYLGGSLDPRRSAEAPAAAAVIVRVSLPEGATLAQTAAAVAEAEEVLAAAPAIGRFWSLVGAGEGSIRAEIEPGSRQPASVSLLKANLGYVLRRLNASVSVETAGAGGGPGASVFLADDAGERAMADDEATFYRFVLRSTDLEALRSGHDLVMSRMGRVGIRYENVQTGWRSSSSRVELAPRASMSAGELRAAAAALRESSTPPEAIRIASEEDRRVVFQAPGSPASAGDVPQREELFRSAAGFSRTPGAAGFRSVLRPVLPAVQRESGRYVLPVRVEFSFISKDSRVEQRQALHESLGTIHVPAGCDLERPSLSRYRAAPEKLRFYAIAALIPICLFAAAAIWLDSFVMAAAALIPGAAGLAATAPFLWAGGEPVDEPMLFSLAAVLCGTAPLGILFLADSGRRAAKVSGSRAAHRAAQAMLGAGGWSVLAIAALLAGSAAGAERGEAAWAPSMRAAAICGGASAGTAILVLPSAALAIRDAGRRRARRRQRGLARPPAWADAGEAPVLAVRNLTKIYPGGVRALQSVEFELRPGIVGLLGPNGAGKTTLLRLLTGLLEPTRGQILFKGVPISPENLPAYRPHVGFLPQEFNAYPGFTAEEFLDYWALQRGIASAAGRDEEIGRLLAAVGLEAEARRKVRDFSGGLRQRIGIARALLGAPPVLIVDEPSTGLDVEGRSTLRRILTEIAAGRIVILSTHIASDVRAAAARVLLLHQGRLRLDLPPADLIARARGRVFETILADERIRSFCDEYEVTARVRVLRGLKVRAVAGPRKEIAGTPVEPTLEEAYLVEIRRADPRSPGAEIGLRSLLWPRRGRAPVSG